MNRFDRRAFAKRLLTFSLFGSLAAAYGTLGAFALRFLYPVGSAKKSWVYVAQLRKLKQGDSFAYKTPDGMSISIVRLGEKGVSEDFLALSDVCPHLGCKVRWEAHNERFFCPCHNGVFNPEGKAIEGPPAKAGQSLMRYPLKVKNGLLYIEVNSGNIA